MKSRKLLKIVSAAALLLLVVTLAFLGYTYWQTKPEKLYVTNVTDRSATISWVSNSATPGVVIVKEGDYMLPIKLLTNGSKVGYDDRDVTKAELEAAQATAENLAGGESVTADDIVTDLKITNYGNYYVHHSTVTGLTPNTEYGFMVGNGWYFHKEAALLTDSETFTTFEELTELATPNPAYGKVMLPVVGDEAEPSEDTVLYMQVDFGGNKLSQVLSSATAENGSWYIDLGNARDEFGNEVDEITDDLTENVWVEGGPNGMVPEFDNPTSSDAPMEVLFLEKDEIEARAPLGFLAGEVNAVCCESISCVDTNGNVVGTFGSDPNFGGGSCDVRRNAAACPTGSVATGGGECGGTGSSNTGSPGTVDSIGGVCSNSANPAVCVNNPGGFVPTSGGGCICQPNTADVTRCGCIPTSGPVESSQPVANPGQNCGGSSQLPCEDLPQPDIVVQEPEVVPPQSAPPSDDPITIDELPVNTPFGTIAVPITPITVPTSPAEEQTEEDEISSWQADTKDEGTSAHTACLENCNGTCNVIDIPVESWSKFATEEYAAQYLQNWASECKPGGYTEVYEKNDGYWYYTCTQHFQWNCESAPTSSLPSLITKAHAQTNPATEEFLFDPSNGVYYVGEAGVYQIEYEGQIYEAVVGESNQSVVLYIDQNANGIFEEGTDIQVAVNPTDLNIALTAEAHTYKLAAGFNFIHLPFIPEDYPMASDLLTYINAEYGGAAYSIAKFDGSWRVVGANGGQHNVNDFQLVPGVGYLLKLATSKDVTITGREVLYETEGDNAPIFFSPGWNLVGIYGSEAQDYTAESWIDGLNEYEATDFNAVNVTRWPIDKGRYEGLQKEMGEDGEYNVYGFDYPVDQYSSYFVRIVSGRGNWQPEMKN